MRITATVVALSAVFASALGAQRAPTVIRAARLIDGTGSPPVNDAVVVVDGDSIRAVGRRDAVAVPANARVIDLGDATILPGFIDAHVHLVGRTLGDPQRDDAIVRDYDSYGAILGVANAQKTLLAGFTSVRNVGAPHFDDMAIRRAINDGRIIGPRMENAGHAIGITGGHCDQNGFKPGLEDGSYKTGVADGPEEIRAAVRYQVKYGADVVKTCATGGVLSEGDAVGATQYTYEEMKALVDEATKLDRKVAAHAHGTEGIKIAVRAGVKRAIKYAVAAGVPIALGTDAGVGEHGTNAREFGLMVEWGGLTPMQSLVAGTSNAAKLLGWDKHVGTLAPGKWADVVVVPGDPLKDIHVTEKPLLVMKAGVVYRAPSQAPAPLP